jgi:hypothetical protein
MELSDLKAPDGLTFAADAEWYEGQPRELDFRDVLRIPPHQVTQMCERIPAEVLARPQGGCRAR